MAAQNRFVVVQEQRKNLSIISRNINDRHFRRQLLQLSLTNIHRLNVNLGATSFWYFLLFSRLYFELNFDSDI